MTTENKYKLIKNLYLVDLVLISVFIIIDLVSFLMLNIEISYSNIFKNVFSLSLGIYIYKLLSKKIDIRNFFYSITILLILLGLIFVFIPFFQTSDFDVINLIAIFIQVVIYFAISVIYKANNFNDYLIIEKSIVNKSLKTISIILTIFFIIHRGIYGYEEKQKEFAKLMKEIQNYNFQSPNYVILENQSDTISSDIPKPLGTISDFEAIFSDEQKNRIEDKLNMVNSKGKVEIVIATFDNSYINNISFSEFAFKVANEWGIGSVKTNNGIFICFSSQLGDVQIYTGLGIEKYISNAMVKDVIDTILIPYFKRGGYEEGLIVAIHKFSKISDTYIK